MKKNEYIGIRMTAAESATLDKLVAKYKGGRCQVIRLAIAELAKAVLTK